MGIAGKVAKAFIESKLTPLIVVASIMTGIFALGITPREEEPQILVPMVDVFVSYPGATAREVEERVTKPMTRLLWEIKGVEYIYSTSKPGMSLAIVRFYVGENMEDSLVKLYNKLMSNYDKIPPGVSQPLVKPKSIDDVPILTLTFWSKEYTGYELRRVAVEVSNELKKDKDVSETTVIGGQRRQFRIGLIPSRLRAYGVSPVQLAGMLEKANFSLTAGAIPRENNEYVLKTSGFIRDKEDLGTVVVGVSGERPVYLKDVATIEDGPEEPAEYVLMGFGERAAEGNGSMYEAVTIAVAKKKGANAIEVANRMLDKIRLLRRSIIPQGVEITTTRNYGETAKEKSDELLKHMFIAAFSVTLLIAIALGWREAIVVAVAVPVTLALTIFVSYMFGYTLNRVTLFALIFSIGILVDDAIVVVENIHRHFATKGVSIPTAVAAVDEVGNPTILATFTVIAALLPMGFVSGLMGPYMRPIPIGASAAMLISLFIAFIISPWLSYIVLRGVKKHAAQGAEEHGALGLLNRVYEKNLRSLLDSRSKRITAFIIVGALFLGVILLLYFKVVTVKMLPFDNKSELQVIIDMPEGTTLEETAAVTRKIADYIRTVPEVENLQLYIGTASPFNFNGLVRHYFLRRGGNVSDVQVNLVPKDKRKAQSHEIAKIMRPQIKKIGDEYGARVKIAEVPPGPPVLSTLVAEVYGPDYKRQIEIAEQIRRIFEETEGVVDVDWYVEDEQDKIVMDVDREKAALHGISVEEIAKTVGLLTGGGVTGLVHAEYEKEPVELLLRSPIEERYDIDSLSRLTLPSQTGVLVPLADLVRIRTTKEDRYIYSKNLKEVVYVIGDVAGTEESPVYAILKMKNAIGKLTTPDGHGIKQYYATQPYSTDKYSMKWDGEWHITYEVFRDLGIAFAAVLILIYVMVVGWFKSFGVPIVIMAPIPLSLIGIVPGHAAMGAFFTATSMIGFIAGAGIVVRNSIILVDFIELKLAEGMKLKDAVVEAGVIRFRPMLLTASAVVVGSSVILFDPIFQGMAISLMAGEVAATLLSRTMVPVLYYMWKAQTI